MLQTYIQKALQKAQYKRLEDGSWFAEVPGLQGVWANGDCIEFCREELSEVIEEWLFLKIHDHDEIPVLDGIQLKIEKRKIA